VPGPTVFAAGNLCASGVPSECSLELPSDGLFGTEMLNAVALCTLAGSFEISSSAGSTNDIPRLRASEFLLEGSGLPTPGLGEDADIVDFGEVFDPSDLLLAVRDFGEVFDPSDLLLAVRAGIGNRVATFDASEGSQLP